MTEVSERKSDSFQKSDAYEEYGEIAQFYARQMRLLDEGDAEGWALTFADDGVFRSPARPAPVTGRANIRDGARATVEDLAARKIVRRHWMGMLEVERQPDGSAHALSYAQVIETPRGGQPALRMTSTCADILVREDGRWVVRDRTITRDDLH
jgi:3-phenylpropionate/cinnamic acid dioxygenase small subunit